MTAPLDPEFVEAEPTLFEVSRRPAPAFGEGLSYEARLTIRRKADLDNGIHPTTKLHLAPEGHDAHSHTCGDCRHHFEYRAGKTHHKCHLAKAGLAHGPLSDVRVRWPACTAWEAQ